MRLLLRQISFLILFVSGIQTALWAAAGETAVITLVFPPGARSTGMGETFTGIADETEATFYNVAGLGQTPLANSWKVHNLPAGIRLTTTASKARKDFGKRERIWVGTTAGLIRYNGKIWEAYDSYVIQDGDNLRNIAEKFINVDDDALIQRGIRIIKEENGIDVAKSGKIRNALHKAIIDTTLPQDRVIEELTDAILSLDKADYNSTRIYGLIAARVDSTMADSLSEVIAKAMELDDIRFSDLVDLRIPFRIAMDDSITALRIDKSDRLWVGTFNGLWNFDGTSWNRFTVLDGLPSNRIHCLDIGNFGEVLIGTDRGAAQLSEGQWKTFSVSDGLPDSLITAVAYGEFKNFYIGTNKGLSHFRNNAFALLDTAAGLLSMVVTTLTYSSTGALWIGSEEGVTIFDKTSWKRYRFPESKVQNIAEYDDGQMWIGTTKGVINYQAGRVKTGPDGTLQEQVPSWKVFHSKNALVGDNVVGLTIHNKDVWVVTDRAVNQYDRAEMQYSFFWEPVLPAFGLKDLWHMYISGVIPTHEWGTIGFAVNYLALGVNEWTDELGKTLGRARSWEGIFGLCYGLPIKEDFSFGLHVKFINSALAPGFGENGQGVGQTFAIDAAILKRNLFIKNLALGFQIANMGPSIYYISRDQSDPIPFNLRLGLSYQLIQTPVIDLQIAADVDREFAHRDENGKPDPFYKALFTDVFDREPGQTWTKKGREVASDIIGHVGMEFWYVRFVGLRMGYMHDEAGQRQELHMGVGFRYGNLGFDWSYIHSPNTSIARHQQWQIAMNVRI